MSSHHCALRDLTEDDLAWMADQERVIFGAAAWSLSLIREDFRYGTTRYRGAQVDGALVGYAVYGYDGDIFQLLNLAVVPGARRGGVARALMDDVFAEARSLSEHHVWLEVAVTNTAALALYRAYGFETVRIRPRYYQPEDVDAAVMRAQVPPESQAS